MSVSRMIDTGMWNDSRFEEFTMAAKYLFVYLLTTPVASLCGCYEIGFRRISTDTGLERESIKEAIGELKEAGVIDTDGETHEVMLVNWPKHNWNRSPKLNRPLADSIDCVKSPRLRQILVEKYQNTRKIPYPYPIDTVSIPYGYPIDTPSIPYGYGTDTPSIPITTTTPSNSLQPTSSSSSDVIGGGEYQELPESAYRSQQDAGAFIDGALVIWNNVTGQNLRRFPDSSIDGLLAAFSDGRTLEDIRSVAEHAMTWEPRYRTPHGAFAEGRIEQWLNRPGETRGKEAEHPGEADCPKCGETCSAVNPGMYRCDECDITWRAAS